MVRTLELTINRRLDGVLHGNHQGITPGTRQRAGRGPAVPARRRRPPDRLERHRPHPGDPRPRADRRPRPRGLARRRHVGGDALRHDRRPTRRRSRSPPPPASASSPPATRTASAPCSSPDPHLKVMPPRVGRDQVRAILANAIATPPPSEGLGRADLAGAIDRVAVVCERRGFVAVISDFAGDAWVDPLARLGLRHDLLAITVHDPRELDVPPVGLVEVVDPSTGRRREVRVTAAVQRRFAEAAAEQVEQRRLRHAPRRRRARSSWRPTATGSAPIVATSIAGARRPSTPRCCADDRRRLPRTRGGCGGCSWSSALGRRPTSSC